jgi:hypothetical protein
MEGEQLERQRYIRNIKRTRPRCRRVRPRRNRPAGWPRPRRPAREREARFLVTCDYRYQIAIGGYEKRCAHVEK